MAPILWSVWVLLSLFMVVIGWVIPVISLVFTVFAICGLYAFYAAVQRSLIEEEIVLTKAWQVRRMCGM